MQECDREAYQDLATLDGCTVFPFRDGFASGACAHQKRQNEANVSLGKMYSLIPFRIGADLGQTNPFFTRSSQSSRTLADPAIGPGRNRANEPIAVFAVICSKHSSTWAATGNQRNEPIAVIAIGPNADPCSPGIRADRRNEANVILDRICRLERRTVAWQTVRTSPTHERGSPAKTLARASSWYRTPSRVLCATHLIGALVACCPSPLPDRSRT